MVAPLLCELMPPRRPISHATIINWDASSFVKFVKCNTFAHFTKPIELSSLQGKKRHFLTLLRLEKTPLEVRRWMHTLTWDHPNKCIRATLLKHWALSRAQQNSVLQNRTWFQYTFIYTPPCIRADQRGNLWLSRYDAHGDIHTHTCCWLCTYTCCDAWAPLEPTKLHMLK